MVLYFPNAPWMEYLATFTQCPSFVGMANILYMKHMAIERNVKKKLPELDWLLTGTSFFFYYSGNIIIPSDENIFVRMDDVPPTSLVNIHEQFGKKQLVFDQQNMGMPGFHHEVTMCARGY